MEDSPRWVKVVQEQEREIARLEAERERLRRALERAIRLLELDAPMRARDILELRKELEDATKHL